MASGGDIGKALSQPYVLIRCNTARRLIVKLHDKPGHLVAHCLLPYEFIVKANGNGGRGVKPRRTPRQRTPLSELPPLSPLSEFLPLPVPVLETQSPEPPASLHSVSLYQHSQRNSNHIAPALRKLAPADGPVSGGPTILISGINFPPPTQLIIYARFGTAVAPTVWLVLLSQQKIILFVVLAKPIYT